MVLHISYLNLCSNFKIREFLRSKTSPLILSFKLLKKTISACYTLARYKENHYLILKFRRAFMGRFLKFWAKTYFGKSVGFNKQLWNF